MSDTTWPAPDVGLRLPESAADLDSWVAYHTRAQHVYWNRKSPACRAKGPGRAECLLAPHHVGRHYGNGNDLAGPCSPIEWSNP